MDGEWSTGCERRRRRCTLGIGRWSNVCAARWRTLAARCAIAPRLSRAKSLMAAAGGRPPLRRVSGDVVTAGLNSSRVWFGPVSGSP
ncbi:hypothetical protein F511_47682 [Dorcoceras hygrometricum]|uniref:Uncharacterized protein n=1 Tax=Dorcoceras hygrometricum TaxID=472368 RepID=A0A2Z6ZWU7_9LAMI|nr:hypothetical protein F511_47682 [Dorcoceras hygrometricum]